MPVSTGSRISTSDFSAVWIPVGYIADHAYQKVFNLTQVDSKVRY